MKRFRFLSVAFVALVLWGCEKKVKVPQITEWAQFQDPFFRVTFTYPKGWHVVVEPNKVIVYSSQEAMEKFFDPTSSGKAGAQVIVTSERDSLANLEKYVNSYESDKKAEGFEIKSKQHVAVDSLDAIELQYSGRFDEKTTLTAARTFMLKDSMMYYVHYGAYNELFEPYKVVYDSVLASLVLPKPRVFAKNVDPSLPVEDLDKFSNDVLELTYPANFSPSLKQPGKDIQFAMELKGYRQDCFINIDVRPAKGLTLDKVVEQNTKNIKASKQSTTVGGEKAVFINETPVKNIDRRTYFIVKNDKFYRIILTYYSPMKKEFLPAFEKAVASIRLK
jgi:hypothetical protein